MRLRIISGVFALILLLKIQAQAQVNSIQTSFVDSLKKVSTRVSSNIRNNKHISLFSAHTKDCPQCHSCIEKNGGCNHMQCLKCKHHFCWMCFGGYSYYIFNYSNFISLRERVNTNKRFWVQGYYIVNSFLL